MGTSNKVGTKHIRNPGWDTPPTTPPTIPPAHRKAAGEFKRVVFGDGETVSSAYQQGVAREWFLGAVTAVAPHVQQDLLGIANLRLAIDAYTQWSSDDDMSQSTGLANLKAAVHAWQARYCLKEPWIHDAAIAALQRAVRPLLDGSANGLTIEHIVPSEVGLYPATPDDSGPWADKLVHTGTEKSGSFDVGPIHLWTEIPVFLDSLYLDPQHMANGESEDDGLLGTFDPRTDSLTSATSRLLEALRPRVRQALESVVADDRQFNGALTPATLGSPDSFVWLVRYQVHKESRGAIARAVRKDKAQISRSIAETAQLVGLTLREHKGARPKKVAP